jgi:hypothetical protein
MIRLATGILLASAAGLTAALAWEVGAFAPADRAAVSRPRNSVAAPTAAAPADHAGDWVATILARPLLSPDRRPPSLASEAPRGDRLPDGLPRLSGVLVGPFGRNAVFAVEGAKPVVVSEGGRINGWTVRLIEAGEVQVVGPGGAKTVRPSFEATPAAPSPPAAPGQRIGLSRAQ